MAREVVEIIKSDKSGKVGAQAYEMVLAGKRYTVDLLPDEWDELTQPLVSIASPTKAVERPKGTPKSAKRPGLRRWAIANGLLPAGSNGRVPNAVIAAYDEAHRTA